QSRERDGERADRTDADDADALADRRPPALEAAQDDGRRLDQHGSVERDGVREAVDDVSRRDDELAVAAAAGEAEAVVVRTEMRVACLAAGAAVARDQPLAHDPLARLQVCDALADRRDRAAPLVSRNAR